MGKHSGRNAFKDKAAELGYPDLNEELVNNTFKKFKDLADKKKHVFDEDIIALIDEGLGELHWFERKLFETYHYEEHSIQSLHEATKISRNTIWVSLNKTKAYLIKKAQDENLLN